MNIIKEVIIDNHKYQVFYDDNLNYSDWDWESKEEKERFNRKIETGELTVFGMCKFKQCECCASWILIDSVGGMISETWEDCLKEYRESYEV